MRAIVTVVGRDRIGIIAGICTLLADKNVNILDISQTILQDNFTMVMVVDTTASTVGFDKLISSLNDIGQRLEINIRIQREEIFNAMHRI